jgi:hypothetical protein
MTRSPLRPLAVALVLAIAGGPAHAVFINGGFEQNSFQGWTLGGGSNPGLAGNPPFTGASIQINGSTPGPASIVGQGSTDPRAPQILLPRVGSFTAKINDEATGARITTLRQTDVLTSADIDPADGLPHLRFAFAPVLDDPSHQPQEQPYFYVAVRNSADNTVLFEQFAYSGQPGVNFLNDVGNWRYLPFQNVDAVLPASAIGQAIELTTIAADCSLGGHAGYVYIDGFGSAPVGGPTPPRPAMPVPALDRTGLLLLALVALAGGLVSWRRS